MPAVKCKLQTSTIGGDTVSLLRFRMPAGLLCLYGLPATPCYSPPPPLPTRRLTRSPLLQIADRASQRQPGPSRVIEGLLIHLPYLLFWFYNYYTHKFISAQLIMMYIGTIILLIIIIEGTMSIIESIVPHMFLLTMIMSISWSYIVNNLSTYSH